MQESGSNVLKIWDLTKKFRQLVYPRMHIFNFQTINLLSSTVENKRQKSLWRERWILLGYLLPYRPWFYPKDLSLVSILLLYFSCSRFSTFHSFLVCQYRLFTKLLQLLIHLRSVSQSNALIIRLYVLLRSVRIPAAGQFNSFVSSTSRTAFLKLFSSGDHFH